MEHQHPRLLRRPEVKARTGIPCSTLYRLMANGQFPRPMKIGMHGRWTPAWAS